VSGAPTDRPSRLVAPAEAIALLGHPSPFVSRGGQKLDAALEAFGIDVSGQRALDAGASTGGFTDCLLQRGATSVFALDVGRGQLHERLRRDQRVTSLERTNVRGFTLTQAGCKAFTIVVADLSFISLRTVAPVLLGDLAAPGAAVVALVKPQFEVGRAAASEGRGVIRDPALWETALVGVASAFGAAGAAIMGAMVSPITGADGNVEFFLHASAHAEDGRCVDLAAVVRAMAPRELPPSTGPTG
jgi:23S rRNA (cytidine1920-2'-O)/16S rRNA (cytidine1409-2'-O)-methyltransferase